MQRKSESKIAAHAGDEQHGKELACIQMRKRAHGDVISFVKVAQMLQERVHLDHFAAADHDTSHLDEFPKQK